MKDNQASSRQSREDLAKTSLAVRMDSEALPMRRHRLYGHNPSQDKRRQELDIMNETVLLGGFRPDVVFLGDSLTQRWELNAFFHPAGQLILNRGIGGDTAGLLLERFEVDVLQLRPRLVILEAGVNDTWVLDGHGGIEEEGLDAGGVADRILTHLGNMAQMAESAGIQVVIGSIPPTGDVPWAPSRELRNRTVKLANEKLREFCRKMRIPFADYHAVMVQEDGLTLSEGLSEDGIHPGGRGYEIMADVLTKVLATAGLAIGHADETGKPVS